MACRARPDGRQWWIVVSLACADDDAQGEELEVFWDHEVDRRILEEERWQDLAARGFDDPRQFAAYLNTLRWNTVTATEPNLFQAPFRAGITIDAYQMEPLRKALRLPRVNLFIADDTGLGKTIEAGLIARELLLRKKAKTVVHSRSNSRAQSRQTFSGSDRSGAAGGTSRMKRVDDRGARGRASPGLAVRKA